MFYARFFIIINFLFSIAYSQNAEYFHLIKPVNKIHGSHYNSIDFIDSRADTNDFGKVYSTKARRLLPTLPRIDFYTQFNWLLSNLIDSTAKNNELLIQLRKFKFFEFGEKSYDCGYCTLRMDIYARKQNEYVKIARLDSVIYLEEINNITTSLFDATSQAINNFITNYLATNFTNNAILTREEILKIDEVEKKSIPLYNDKYANGIYLSFESFKNQIPDQKLLGVDKKQGQIETLIIFDKKGKTVKRKWNTVVAFVFDNKPYIVGDLGSYVLEKNENDFYFNAKARVLADGTSMVYAKKFGLLLGGISGYFIGAGIAKNSAKDLFKTKLDHIDGSFIMLKRIN